MAGKYLYGNLNQETVRPTYGGSTTDSVKVTVDNDTMIISADVIWDAALGEIAGKAYPGDSGARDYKLIQQLTEDLENEIKTASESRTNLSSKVEAINIDVNKKLTQLTNALTALSTSTSETDNEMLAKCAAETQRALGAEADLLELITNESKLRDEEDADLEKLINSLKTSNTTNQSQLQQLIADEATRAQEAEKNLAEDIKKLSATVTNTAEVLRGEIEKLADNASVDAVTFEAALAAEAKAREDADKALETKFDTKTAKLDSTIEHVETSVSTLQADVIKLDSADTALLNKLTAAQSDIKDLRKDLTTAKEEIDNAKKSTALGNSLLQSKLDQTNEDVADLEGKLNTAVDDLTFAIANVTKDVDTTTKVAHKELTDTSKQLSDELAQKVTELQASDTATKTYTDDQVEAVKEEVTNVQSSLTATQELVTDLQTRVVVLEAARGTIEARLDSLEGADGGENYAQQIANINTVLLTVQNNIKTIDIELESVSKSVISLNDKLVTNETADAELATTVETNTTAIADAVIRIVACEKAVLLINNSIATLEDRIATLETDISDIITDIANLQTQLGELNKQLNNVTLLAEEVREQDAKHDKQLDAHETRLLALESEVVQQDVIIEQIAEDTADVQADVDAVRTNLVIEQKARSSAIAIIRGALEDEIRRATAAEERLVDDIANNSTRITNCYNDLVELIDNYVTDLKIKDQQLYNAIAAIDIKTVKSQLTTLTSDFTIFKAETTANIEAVNTSIRVTEAKLQTQIDSIDVNKNSISKVPNDGSELTVYSQLGEETFVKLAAVEPIQDSIVVRDENGNIHISSDKTKITDDTAVSKSYVESLVKDLLKDVDIDVDACTFDFIEGGKAPVE